MSSSIKGNQSNAAAGKVKLATPSRIKKYNDSSRSQMNGESLITSKDFDFKVQDTLEKSQDNTISSPKAKIIKKPDYVNEMSIQDKLMNQKIIKNMNKKITFMKNPRFRIIRPPIQFTDLATKPGVYVDMNNKECPFRAYPEQLIFLDYEIDKIYEIKLNITNIDSVSRRIKFLPPQQSCFSIKDVKYPTPLPKSEYDEHHLQGQELGMVAPGMSVIFTIQYYAKSLAEQYDFIEIINEINAFKVPIRAKRNPPEINLPSVLDCKSCWIGDKSVQVFKITNRGGDCGFRFFCENEDDDMDGEIIVTGNFDLFPAEFYLQNGETQEIVVTFVPQREGEETRKIILACDNHTSAEYTLKGSGNMAEVQIYGIDQLRVSDYKESEGMSRIFFEDALPGIQKTRKLLLKNQTDVHIKFHWNLFKEQTIQQIQQPGDDAYQTLFDNKEDYNFTITPSSGVFQPQQILEFQISFLTTHPVPIFENATFFIDEIPFESIRNISEHLQQYMRTKMENPTPIPKENLPGFVGSNSARPSVAYLDLKLVGLSSWAKVTKNKPFQLFPQPLAVHQEYQDSFLLKNESSTSVNFDISIINTNQVTCFVENETGSIPPHSSFEVKITFTSNVVGQNQKAMLNINFDISHTLSYEVIGNFVGPNIRIIQPLLDFGLMRSFEHKTVELVLENTSPVAAEVAIRDINEKKKSGVSNSLQILSTMRSNNTLDTKGLEEIQQDRQEELEFLNTKCQIDISEKNLLIQPFEKRTIKVKCKSGVPESYKTILEISVEHSNDSLFLNVQAEIQKVQVSLNRISLDFPCLYANNVNLIDTKHSKQYIQLQNLGNIETEFEWEIPENPNFKIEFNPQKGKIKPKSKINLKISLTAYKGESLDQIFVCNIKDMKYPLGFSICTKIFGLTVSVDRVISQDENENKMKLKVAEENDNTNLFNSLIMKSYIKNSHLLRSMRETEDYKNFEITQKLSKQNNPGIQVPIQFKKETLRKLEFFGCEINKPKSMFILLSNTSGIHTKFNIYSDLFQPFGKLNADGTISFAEIDESHLHEEEEDEQTHQITKSRVQIQDEPTIHLSPEIKNPKMFNQNVSNVQSQQNSITESSMFNQSKLQKSNANYRISKMKNKTNRITTVSLLTSDLEKVKNFNSKAGQELNAARKLDKEQRFHLQNDKGFAIVCEPSQGSLNAHQEQIVKISVFNDISGRIEDHLMLEIEGLETRKIPITVDVQGSPVIVSPYQLGVNYKGPYPTFDLGSFMKNGTLVEREFKITNTGPKTVKIDWKMYNLNSQNSELDFFDIKIQDPDLGSSDICKLNFNPIAPPEATNGPFFIQPQGMIIEGREEKTFKVTFQNEETSDFIAVLIAQPVIVGKDGHEESHIKIDQLILQIQAHTHKPRLYLDKLLTHDDKHILKFDKWALFQNRKESKEICLVNKDFATVKFDLEIEGPFRLDEVNSTSKTNVLNSMIVKQQRSLTKELRSNQGKLPLQMTYTLEMNTNMKLIIHYIGQKVHDEQNWPMTYKNYEFGKLHIKYTNGDEQVIDLEGHLLRPLIQLNTSGHEDIPGDEIQDFGVVHINNKKRIVLYLSNISKVPAKWKIHHIKNPFKKFLGTATMTKEENENNNILDDQEVFEFSITEGQLYGPSIPVKSLPETLSLPTMITTMKNHQNDIVPQQIQINFKPKRNVMYKSKYRISVDEGPTVDFILRGTGTYEEEVEI